MATQRQKKVARLIIENAKLDKPLNMGQLVEKGRYSKSMQIKPNRVLESEGVKQELTRLGFSEDGAKQVVEEIMYSPKVDASARLKATDQVFKVQGSYAPEKSVRVNINATSEHKQMSKDAVTQFLNDHPGK